MLAFPRSRALRAVLSGAFVTFAVASCSLLVTDGRCSQDADCLGRAAPGSGAVCRSGACITSAVGPGVDSGDGAVAECQTNAECRNKLNSRDVICVKETKRCQPIASEDCAAADVFGKIEADDAIIIGTLFKQGFAAGSDTGASPDALEAIEKAVGEFNESTSGLPIPGAPNESARPIVLVECNQTSDPERAARHLAEDLRVPAIIGAANTYATKIASDKVTKITKTFLISPYASSPQLTVEPDDGFLWRTYPSDELQGKAFPRLLDYVVGLPEFTTPRAAAPSSGRPIRMLIIYKNDEYGNSLRSIITDASTGIRFNGKNATENQDTGNLKFFSYPNTDDPLVDVDLNEKVAELYESDNFYDVVMILGTSEGVAFLNGLENNWDARFLENAPRPFYLLPDGIASSPQLDEKFRKLVAESVVPSKDLRKRIRGTIVNVFKGPVYDSFRQTFNGNAINGSNAYDAAYVVLYAMYAAGVLDPTSRRPTGTQIRDAMKRFVGGPEQKIGPAQLIRDALAAIEKGNIVLKGASSGDGFLDWDLEHGDVRARNAAVWCLRQDDANGALNLVTDTGQIYDGVSGTLVGTFPETGTKCNF